MGNGWFPSHTDDNDYVYETVDNDGYVTEDYKRYLDYMEQMQYGE